MSQSATVLVAPARANTSTIAHPPLRVAVLSRHALTRAGVAQLLSEGGDRSAVVEGPLRFGPLRGHDVVVLDLTDVTEAVLDDLTVLTSEDVPVVALTPTACQALVETALGLGAAGTVPMDIAAAALLQALELAAADHATDLSPHWRSSRAGRATEGLSDGELAVLNLIGTGLTNHDIAGRLYLSINTVKSYIRSAYRKIGVSRRAQAVLWAVHHERTLSFVSSS